MQSRTTSEQPSSEFTAHERDVTGYLFVRYKAMYPGKFDFIWPSEKEVALSKREFAKAVGRYSREQLDAALDLQRKLAIKGADRDYMEPNPIVTLRLLAQLNDQPKARKMLEIPPPDTAEILEGRRQGAMRVCENLRGLLGLKTVKAED